MKNVWTKYWLLMPVLVAQALAACIETDYPYSELGTGSVKVDMALSVSTAPRTRMADNVTQLNSVFRGLGEIHAIPYDVKGTITKTDNPLLTRVDNLSRIEQTSRYFGSFQDGLVPVGTASFLCYASATPILDTEGKKDKAANGSIATDAFTTQRKATADIRFSPDPIYSSTTVPTTASSIAHVLTDLARTIVSGTKKWYEVTEGEDPALYMLFQTFINEGKPMASSSVNAQKLIDGLQTAAGYLDESHASFKTAILQKISNISIPTGYPASIGLPDGTAVVQWTPGDTENEPAFEVKTQTTTITPMTSTNRIVYPAELYYYANSQIFVSNTDKTQDDYKAITEWTAANLRTKFEYENGVVSSNTRSVAISKPLQYAVGCMKANVVATASALLDAEKASIPLTNGSNNPSFPVTGLLVSGQFPQYFDFTPVVDNTTECVIYDKNIQGISLSYTATPPYFHTLVFQSKETNAPIKVVLEFQNNSGHDFMGVNGVVYQGTKFYLVGQLQRPNVNGDDEEDYRNRVFTKNYITQMQLKVDNLANAYNVVPDLISARLELGVELIPKWIAATPTNVPF